jgi:DMSO/TMAO reductase YedYZ molybdopterin-dependent catalytic subunit
LVRRVITAGAKAGAIGALVMILAQAIARLAAGVPMFPDLFEDATTRAIPAVLFSFVLDALKFQAKPLLFVGLLVLQIVVGAVLGIVYALFWGGVRDPEERWSGWRGAFEWAGALWVATNLVLLPLAGQGLFGRLTTVGSVALNVELVIAFALLGLTTAGSYRLLAPTTRDLQPATATEQDGAANVERRRLLGGVAVGAVAILAAGATYKILTPDKLAPGPAGPIIPPTNPNLPGGLSVVAAQPGAAPVSGSVGQPAVGVVAAPPAANQTPSALPVNPAVTPLATPSTPPEWTIPGLTAEVTPTKDFYQVSKNFFSDPVVDPNTWTLQIAGLVKQPMNLTYAQLLQLPAIERYETLECISNEVGGDLISNASWRGVSLHDLIASANPDSATKKVVFSAADGYQDSITFERAMSPENLLVYGMNGSPLLPAHGAPARLLIPGIYGMKNVKWVTKIELVDTDFQGYWQQRGWSDQADYQTMSRIDIPNFKSVTYKNVTLLLAGIAFAGDQGISKVEVSLDGGQTWSEAELKEPLGKFTWRLWKLQTPAAAGQHNVIVRATDGSGKLQVKQPTDTLPNGATGWMNVDVSL